MLGPVMLGQTMPVQCSEIVVVLEDVMTGHAEGIAWD
jgi:hypothetical protein